MLTTSALRNAVFLTRVKAAAIEAVKTARAYRAGKGAPRFGYVDVTARRTGKLSLVVAWCSASGLQFFDNAGSDVTGRVLTALRAFHAGKASAAGKAAAVYVDKVTTGATAHSLITAAGAALLTVTVEA